MAPCRKGSDPEPDGAPGASPLGDAVNVVWCRGTVCRGPEFLGHVLPVAPAARCSNPCEVFIPRGQASVGIYFWLILLMGGAALWDLRSGDSPVPGCWILCADP